MLQEGLASPRKAWRTGYITIGQIGWDIDCALWRRGRCAGPSRQDGLCIGCWLRLRVSLGLRAEACRVLWP